MARAPREVEYLIVGAGPVGLTAALLLSDSGLPVLVIEKNSSTSDEPKAISIDDEALRTLARTGLAERILSLIVPGTGTSYSGADGKVVFRAGAEVPYRLGFPFKNPFAQPDLERLLLAELRTRGNVEMRFQACLTELESRADGARASYASVSAGPPEGGARNEVHARFVLGADGGRSTVRSLLGITMTGRSHEEDWLVVDTLNDEHRERFGMHHGDPRRPHVIVPGLNGRCRYEFRLFPGEGRAGAPPQLSLIRRVLARYRDIESSDIDRAVVYRFNGLLADSWREGSSFLLGDAAHMMPPFAGQGLNSGIRDAANLCWKLVEVSGGRAPASILASYETERREHARATIRLSERLGRVVMTTSERLARHRDARVRHSLGTPEGRDFFEHMRYRPNPRITEGLLAQTPEAQLGLQLGQPRCFDTASSSVALLDAVTGPGWALFRVEQAEAWPEALLEFAREARIPIFDVPLAEVFPPVSKARSSLIDVDGRLAAEFEAYRGRFVLARPDHVVAAAWLPDEFDVVWRVIRTWWLTGTPDRSPKPTGPAEASQRPAGRPHPRVSEATS